MVQKTRNKQIQTDRFDVENFYPSINKKSLLEDSYNMHNIIQIR